MSTVAPDPTSHDISTQAEGDKVRLTCSCGWKYLCTEERFVNSIADRHHRSASFTS